MNEATIIVAGKEFLKGKTQKGRPWSLAKLQDGESGQWFATFDIKSVFKDISFKDLSNGDLLKIDYEEEHNGKYQDLILKAVRRPEFPEQGPTREPEEKSEEAQEALEAPKPNPSGDQVTDNASHLSDYLKEASDAVAGVVSSLKPKKNSISQETIFKAIVLVALEWMRLEQGGQCGNLPTVQR